MILQEPEVWKKKTPAQWERILFGQTLDEWCKSKWEQGVLEREYKNKNVHTDNGTDVPAK